MSVKAAALPRGLIILLSGAAVVVVVFGIQSLSGILGPLFLAMMLVIVVGPVQRWLTKLGVPRWAGTIGILLVLYTILLGLGTVLAISVARLATILPAYANQAEQLIGNIQKKLEELGVGSTQADAIIARIDPNQVLNVLSGILSGLAGVFSNLLFLLLLIFFLGIDAAGVPARLKVLGKVRPSVGNALSSFINGTRRYIAVSTIFGVICAVLDAAALAWISIPLPYLWGMLAFITNYIPNIGFFIGLVPPALLGLLDGGVSRMLWVVGAYVAINFVIQTLIQPKYLGNSVGITITMTFLGLTFWAWALGPLGALLAIPLTLLAKALLIDIDPATRWMNLFIEARPEGIEGPQRKRQAAAHAK